MTEPPSQKSPAERALDLAVYGPLGLALSIAEAMPAMARKGRSRFVPQVGLARTVGQLAVQHGYRQLRDMAASGPNIPFLSRGPAGANGAVRPRHVETPAPDSSVDGPSASPGPRARTASRAATDRPAARNAPGARDLAIPSYDSLSASQVVQRLAGLSYDEVAAVQAYESATRGRRTILSRAEQLLG
jgi:hypothetical protein